MKHPPEILLSIFPYLILKNSKYSTESILTGSINKIKSIEELKDTYSLLSPEFKQ